MKLGKRDKRTFLVGSDTLDRDVPCIDAATPMGMRPTTMGDGRLDVLELEYVDVDL